MLNQFGKVSEARGASDAKAQAERERQLRMLEQMATTPAGWRQTTSASASDRTTSYGFRGIKIDAVKTKEWATA